MITPTLEELDQAEQQAMVRVAEARAAARELRDRREERRAQAQKRHDEETLAAWSRDRNALDKAVDEARENLRQAVLANPMFKAYGDLILAAHRRTLRSAEASGVSARRTGRSWVPEPMPMPPDFDMLVTIVEQDATDRGRAEQQEREQRRVDAGNAAADEVGR